MYQEHPTSYFSAPTTKKFSNNSHIKLRLITKTKMKYPIIKNIQSQKKYYLARKNKKSQ
jgi:hypothetical protein